MKKISESEVRAAIGFGAFFGMILLTAGNGVYLTDFQYMLLFTIMLAGFIGGGRK